jgi:hypothetical protein
MNFLAMGCTLPNNVRDGMLKYWLSLQSISLRPGGSVQKAEEINQVVLCGRQ